jgi:hypothetical protein
MLGFLVGRDGCVRKGGILHPRVVPEPVVGRRDLSDVDVAEGLLDRHGKHVDGPKTPTAGPEARRRCCWDGSTI